MNLLILLLLSGLSFAQENFSFHGGPDTTAFKTVYKAVEEGQESLKKEDLLKYQVVFVQGLSTDLTHKLGLHLGPIISEQAGFLSPFYQQKKFLKRIGVDSFFAPINPNESCEQNGKVIANFINRRFAASRKKIILITQSKAGPDVLHGLMGNPEAIQKIAGWIAYQPPHGGTLLADVPTSGRVRNEFIHLLFRTLKGSGLAIAQMRRDYRRSFMGKYKGEISSLLKHVPTVTLVTDDLPLNHPETGSLIDFLLIPVKGQSDTISFLAPFVRPLAEDGGGLNDGIATVNGTCLSGGRSCVYLHGIDHFAAVMNTSPYKTLSEKEREILFQSLLITLLKAYQSSSRLFF